MLISGVTQSMDSFLQFMTVLIIFVIVLGITYFTTKWIAGYQKSQMTNSNVHVIETSKLSGSKYVQILKIGEKYIAVAVCKDSVTVLTEIPSDQVKLEEDKVSPHTFEKIFEKVKKAGHDDHKDSDN